MKAEYGIYGERLTTQDRFAIILNAVELYVKTHPGTDSLIVQEPTPHFEQYMAACGIDMEEIESNAYDLTYCIDRNNGII